MTKADKVLIICLMVLSICLIVPIVMMSPQSTKATVTVKQKEVLQIDLAKEDTYTVAGTLGDVHIEVKDHKVRVTQENSPHHTCSKQGFVSDVNIPIVCLPNETVITIQSKTEDSMDTVIQ